MQVPDACPRCGSTVEVQDGVNNLDLAQASLHDFGRVAHPKMQRTLNNDMIDAKLGRWRAKANARMFQTKMSASCGDKRLGAGGLLTATPEAPQLIMQDELLTFAMRLRLGMPLAQEGDLHTKHSHGLWVSLRCRDGSCSWMRAWRVQLWP